MRVVVFFLVAVCFAGPCVARTIYVDVSGPNEPGKGSAMDPFRRIQDAVDDANDGDVIEIQPGLYTGAGNFRIEPRGKAITISSKNPDDLDIVAATIIDPEDADLGFYVHNGEDANCVISGLTIQNAHAGGSGGAINCDNTSPTIRNCLIINNSAVWGGGGVYCLNSSSAITNCVIAANSAHEGGGIRCSANSSVTVVNCTVAGNYATLEGGAIYCFAGNVTVKNCILWANSAARGEQIALPFSFGLPNAASLSYSDVQSGDSAVYDPCNCLTWGPGNIDAGPYFASFEMEDPPGLWDLHLCSTVGRWDPNSRSWLMDSQTSPCIDAGDPNSDCNAEIWPNGKCINMGVYGGTPQASMNGNKADFNVDGTVDFADYAQFADKWPTGQASIEDLNHDGEVDWADLAVFVEDWLWHRQ